MLFPPVVPAAALRDRPPRRKLPRRDGRKTAATGWEENE
jgi:hypothetical protein